MIGQRATPLPDRRARARMAYGRLRLISWLTAKDPLAPASRDAEARRFWLAWAPFLTAFAVALACFATVWWTGIWKDWQWFWVAVVIVAFMVGGPWSLRTRRRDIGMHREINDLLAAIINGDSAITPDATRQPAALTPEEVAASSGQQIAVYQPQALSQAQPAYSAGTYIFLGIMFLAQNLVAVFPPGPLSGWQGTAASACMLTLGLVGGARLLARRRPISVSTNAEGLEWRLPGIWGRGGRAHSLPWRELRAFSVFSVPAGTAADGRAAAFTVFAALGSRDTLTWTLWAKGYHRRGGDTPPGQEDPAWRLCRLIASYSGQPLRDPTDATVRLFQSRGPTSAAPVAAQERAPRRPAISPWIAGVLALSVTLAGVGLVIFQPRGYAARLAQIETFTPLYADALSTPSGDWPQGAQPGGTYQYRDGAYVLTEGTGDECCDIYAWPARTFADATVEVAVRQTTDFDLAKAGLVLRADDANGTMLVFTVTTSGEWLVDRFRFAPNHIGASGEQQLLYSGVILPVGAIHTGSGALNELEAIVRGSADALFINHQFVGIYHDTGLFASGPISGHVGVYAEGLGKSVAFSNFRVYPAPPPAPLYPV